MKSRRTIWLRWCALGGAIMFLAALIGFLAWLPFSWEEHLYLSLAGDSKTWFLALACVSTSLCLYAAFRRFATTGTRLAAVVWTAFSVFAPACASFHFLPAGIEDNKSPSRLLEVCVSLTPPDSRVLAERGVLPSACWHYRRSDIFFFGELGELDYGVRHPGAEGRYIGSPEAAGNWILRELAANRPVAVCMRNDTYARLIIGIGGTSPALRREIAPYVWALYLPPNRSAPDDMSWKE